jgi:hypothetical protein
MVLETDCCWYRGRYELLTQKQRDLLRCRTTLRPSDWQMIATMTETPGDPVFFNLTDRFPDRHIKESRFG